jgi:site-specific DNA recombinase
LILKNTNGGDGRNAARLLSANTICTPPAPNLGVNLGDRGAATEREIRRLIEAIKAGVPGAAVKDEMTTLGARRIDLLGQLEAAPPPMPRLHPNIAEVYRQKIVSLGEALNDEHTSTEAGECIRELIEEIRLVPEKGKLSIQLFGELAALINLASERPRSGGTGVQVTLVAGVGFEPTTFRL